MNTKYILTVMAIVAITKPGFAQYSQDAIRFSTFQTGSTARVKAIGNATTAIGGDLSSVSGNPAGLGFFTRSEVSITPEFNKFNANTSYLGQNNSINTNTLNFNNASGVLYSKLNSPKGSNKEEGWLSLNVGASYNRTNDLYQGYYYAGNNNANSISNYFANLGNTNGVDINNGSNLQDWAYSQNLIDAYSTGPRYQSNVFRNGAAVGSKTVNQNNTITREGGQSEFSLALGANYGNQFYIGLGIGITSLRYNSVNTFNETGVASVLDANNNAVNSNYNTAYTQQQATTGTGFNARLGFIYKPDPIIRIGATITSPTYYNINDDFSEGLRTRYTTGTVSNYTSGPTDYQLTYNFRTPFKASGGLAIFLGNFGFVTGDVEYVDYSSIHLDNADGYSSANDNHDIKTLYKSTANLHAGAEFKLSQLYLRGGYGVQGNPLKTGGDDLKTISGGLGYRFLNYYVDATYANVKGTQSIYPYLTDGTTTNPQAMANRTYDNIFLTFGVRF